MSSHHIVREKQEPALFVRQLGAFDDEYLGQLLEWSPTLIVSAGEYEKALSLGLKVDVIAGSSGLIPFQDSTRVLNSGNDDFSTVLDDAVDHGYSAINIVDSENGYLETLGRYLDKINIVVYTPSEKAYAVRSGFSLWKEAGSTFRISGALDFEADNLKAGRENEFYAERDGLITLRFENNYLIIREAL